MNFLFSSYSVNLQVLLSFLFGMFLGTFITDIECIIIIVIITEVLIFTFTYYYSKEYLWEARFIINCGYLLGWIIGKYCFLNETGFEQYS